MNPEALIISACITVAILFSYSCSFLSPTTVGEITVYGTAAFVVIMLTASIFRSFRS